MKSLIVKTLASVLYYSGALGLLRFLPERYRLERRRLAGLSVPWLTRRRSRAVQILTFHRVNDEGDPFLSATPTRVFDGRVKYLSRHCTLVDAHDLRRLLEEDNVPKRAVVISFDDGYRDVFLKAFPILDRHGASAIVFLPAAHIGTGKPLWHDQVVNAFAQTERSEVTAFGENGSTHPLATMSDRVRAFGATMDFLRSLDSDERARWLDRLHEELDVEWLSESPGLMMTWDEVRQMQRGGVAFGSHTINHPILSRMAPDEAAREISESKALIEAELGRPVRVLAYPNGTRADFSEANKEAARTAGYDCALTTIFGLNQTGQDLYELRRGGPWEEHLPTFALKLHWYRLTG